MYTSRHFQNFKSQCISEILIANIWNLSQTSKFKVSKQKTFQSKLQVYKHKSLDQLDSFMSQAHYLQFSLSAKDINRLDFIHERLLLGSLKDIIDR